MATKTTESNSSSVGKEGAHQLITGETTEHVPQRQCTPPGPLTDEVGALARKVSLKFDLIFVLPILTMLCEWLIQVQLATNMNQLRSTYHSFTLVRRLAEHWQCSSCRTPNRP